MPCFQEVLIYYAFYLPLFILCFQWFTPMPIFALMPFYCLLFSPLFSFISWLLMILPLLLMLSISLFRQFIFQADAAFRWFLSSSLMRTLMIFSAFDAIIIDAHLYILIYYFHIETGKFIYLYFSFAALFCHYADADYFHLLRYFHWDIEAASFHCCHYCHFIISLHCRWW